MPDTRSYIPPVKIGEVMRGQIIGRVVASKSAGFPVGALAMATAGWTELAVVKEADLTPVEVPEGGRITDAMGVLGTPIQSPPSLPPSSC